MITDLSIMYAGPLAWRLRWASDDPAATFRVFRDGLLIAQTERTEALVSVIPGTSPVFEVLEAGGEPSDGFPGFVTLQWAQATATAEYRVEEEIAAVWTTLATVADDGSAYYRWTSETLDDGSTHEYRVVPVGTNGNDGMSLTFVVLMVRVPDPPEFTLEYDQGAGEVTFDLA